MTALTLSAMTGVGRGQRSRGFGLVTFPISVTMCNQLESDNLEFVQRLLAGTHGHSFRFCGHQVQDPNRFVDEKSESRLYIGNLDLRITEATLIKMFSPFGEIVSEDFLWHSRGPKRGEPRGYAFIQFRSKEEAKLAKEKMQGKLVSGRPLVVRLASEKYFVEMAENSAKPAGDSNRSGIAGSCSGQMDRSAKIAAIKNKLKAMEEESRDSKKQKQADNIAQIGSLDPSPVNIQ
ncbi:hypothetical protein RJ639_030110 [Escallonia herrerae]|uniref:Probable RNA-binding protein 18 n=1 Tax=Escallonia herrerae TaxID=1293975 RepID=A0AA89BHZ3_9ASTE|nr:hypothetical protein RJ639_030110 [Escallonia herrerae]